MDSNDFSFKDFELSFKLLIVLFFVVWYIFNDCFFKIDFKQIKLVYV